MTINIQYYALCVLPLHHFSQLPHAAKYVEF